MKGLLGEKRRQHRKIVEVMRGIREKMKQLEFSKEKSELLAGSSIAARTEKLAGVQAAVIDFAGELAKQRQLLEWTAGAQSRLETEILEALDWALRIVTEIFHEGLALRNVPLETRIFYSKMECDYNRYKAEVL